jgi:hypothetical protein
MKILPSLVAGLLAVIAINCQVLANPHDLVTGTADIKTGTSSLTLDSQFSSALETAQFAFKKIIPGRMKPHKGELNFPITGGAFDLTDLHSEIIHSGGFSLVDGMNAVSISDIIITTPAITDTTTLPTLSALLTVNGVFQGRVNLFTLDLTGVTAPQTLPHNKKIVLKDILLKLTADGATALNNAFAVTSFTSDTVVGSVSVNAITAHDVL